MLVSVIIPVYNTAEYLEKCLNSVLTQDYKNIEVLCIDDGSTDLSPKILQEFEQRDARLKVTTIKHSGVSIARNVGIEQAKGSAIMFVDADDYLLGGGYFAIS